MTEPPIRLAIDGTLSTIRSRASAYRNLVICVCVLGPATIAALISWRQLGSLTIASCLLPAVSAWLYQDNRILTRWCKQTAEYVQQAKIDVEVFKNVITSIEPLPKSTLNSMLQELEKNQRTGYQHSHSLGTFHSTLLGLSSIGSVLQIAGWLTGQWLPLVIGITVWLASSTIAKALRRLR